MVRGYIRAQSPARCVSARGRLGERRATFLDLSGPALHAPPVAPTARRHDEAHHPDPVPQRRGSASRHPRRPAAPGARHRRRRVARRRRRLDRSHRRRGLGQRRRSRGQADQQPGPVVGLPGRARCRPEAGRGHRGEHRRGQPVPSRRHRPPGRADRRRARRHGDRRPGRHVDRPLLADEEAAPAPRELGRPPGVRHRRARRHVGLPRLQPRGGPGPHRGVDVHVHARVPHPGGQEPRRRRPRPGGHQRQDPRVTPVLVDVVLRATQHAGDLPHLHGLRAAAGLLPGRRGAGRGRRRGLGAVPVGLGRPRRPQRPPAVDHPRRRAAHRRGADPGARRPRRPARLAPGGQPADPRAGAPHRARARRRPVALRRPPASREVLGDTSEEATGDDARRVEVVTVSTAATSD